MSAPEQGAGPKTPEQRAASLDTMEVRALNELAERSRPMPGVYLARLETDGLVEFVRETRSGTTWYRITPDGRAALEAFQAVRP